jgi:hypothetical protein
VEGWQSLDARGKAARFEQRKMGSWFLSYLWRNQSMEHRTRSMSWIRPYKCTLSRHWPAYRTRKRLWSEIRWPETDRHHLGTILEPVSTPTPSVVLLLRRHGHPGRLLWAAWLLNPLATLLACSTNAWMIAHAPFSALCGLGWPLITSPYVSKCGT